MFPDAPRRRSARRRRRVLLPLVITLVFLAFWLAGTFQSDNLVSNAFYDDVRSMGTSQSLAASDFETMLITSAALDRAQYVALMDQLALGIERSRDEISLDDVAPEDVPDRIKTVHSLAEETLRLWSEGLSEFEEASLAIVDNPDDQFAEINLGEALAKIKTGDVLYGVLTQEVEELRIDLELPAGSMSSAAYLPTTAITPGFVDALVGRFASSTGLVGAPGLTIATVRTEPEATGGQEGTATRLPFTNELQVLVVVSNNGNVPEMDFVVTVQVRDIATSLRADVQTIVPVLASGDQTTVTFENLDVVGGEFYTITVSVETALEGAEAPEPFVYEIFVASEAVDTTTTTVP